jgi:hypothetical protein
VPLDSAEQDRIDAMRWGMPLPPRTGGRPVTNIRSTSSPDWRGLLSQHQGPREKRLRLSDVKELFRQMKDDLA